MVSDESVADGEIVSESEESADVEIPTGEGLPAENEDPSEGETSTEVEIGTDDEPEADDADASDEETIVDNEQPADEVTPADAATVGGEDSERTVNDTNINLDDGYTILDAASDYTWDGTTVTGLNYEITDSNERLSLVIPAKATAIGSFSFRYNDNICRVSFAGNNVTSIGVDAFNSCKGMEELVLPDGLEEIGQSAFGYEVSLTSLSIPSTVKKIDQDAFYHCKALTTVDLSEGLKTIGNFAFYDCPALQDIELPDTLESIGWQTFGNCTSITSIVLPAGLTWQYYCGDDTQSDYSTCSDIEYEGMTDASTGGINLADLDYNFSPNPFYGCTNLTYLEYAEGTKGIFAIGAEYVTTVRLPETATTIGPNAFRNYTRLQTINIPKPVQFIKESAFQNCTSLQTIDIPELVSTISKNTFKGCSSLQTTNLSARRIEESAFEGCTALSDLVFASHCSKIGDNAFKDCTGLTTLRFEGSPSIQDTAFDGVAGDEDVLVYCSSGSSPYKYFIDKEGFRVISINTITYSLGGGTNNENNPTSYTTGDDLTFYDPTRAGYEFKGWFTDVDRKNPFVYDKNTTNGNLVLYAGWTEITYSITYDLNGGILPGGATNPSTYTALRNVTLVSPTKDGAVFVGWKVNDTDEIITEITANTYAEDLTLTAQWREYAYQIIWNKNAKDATGTMDPVTIGYSEPYTIPQEEYNRAGYDLAGWNTKANGKGTSYAVGDVVQGLASKDGAKVTLYAQWQKSIYEIVYVLNDSVLSPATNHKSNPDSYNVGQKIKLQNPTRTGYTFGGWYTDEACTQKVTTITKDLGDVTVYAKWTANSYTITFNANKGKGTMDAVKAGYDERITLPANAFIRTGYTFTGWNTKANGKGMGYLNEQGQVSNLAAKNNAKVVLYAQWQVNQVKITYVLNDTEEDPATNAAKNPAYVTIEKNVVLAAPTRAGYKFGGWFTDEARTQALAKNTIAKTTTEPVTVYAAWTPNSYTLKLDKNGGTYAIPAGIAGKHAYTEEITLPDGEGATRTNYDLTGWNTKKDRSGTHYGLGEKVSGLAAKGTVTLYAEWTPVEDKTYSITYHGIDESWDNSKNPSVYSFEKDIKLANPTKAGYTFKGWYAENPSENPKAKKVTKIAKTTAADTTVHAQWSENRYSLRFSGASVKSITNRLYTDELTIPSTTPVKDGYTFKGWALTRDGVPVCYPEDTISFEELHAAGGIARGVIGTKYMTLYAIFE